MAFDFRHNSWWAQHVAASASAGPATFYTLLLIGGFETSEFYFSAVANWYTVMIFFLFPVAAMLYGQIGALRAASAAGVWKNLKQELEFKHSLQVGADSLSVESGDAANFVQAPFQFGMKHLLIGCLLYTSPSPRD